MKSPYPKVSRPGKCTWAPKSPLSLCHYHGDGKCGELFDFRLIRPFNLRLLGGWSATSWYLLRGNVRIIVLPYDLCPVKDLIAPIYRVSVVLRLPVMTRFCCRVCPLHNQVFMTAWEDEMKQHVSSAHHLKPLQVSSWHDTHATRIQFVGKVWTERNEACFSLTKLTHQSLATSLFTPLAATDGDIAWIQMRLVTRALPFNSLDLTPKYRNVLREYNIQSYSLVP
jgi:hypothetical protein